MHACWSDFSDPREAVTDATPDNDQLFETVYVEESNWKASFPQSIPDFSFGIVKFAGGQQGSLKQRPSYNPQNTWITFDWEPVCGDVYKENSSTEREKVGEHQTIVLEPMENGAGAAKSEIQEEFLKRYGKDAAEWFVPGFYERVRAGPKKGEPPFQYVHPRQLGNWAERC